jgi:hypothetical protein
VGGSEGHGSWVSSEKGASAREKEEGKKMGKRRPTTSLMDRLEGVGSDGTKGMGLIDLEKKRHIDTK